MIKATELRIGNYVTLFDVKEWAKIHLVCKTVVQVEGDLIGGETFGLKDVHPIPLTPEILEKAGFERYDRGWKIKDQFFLQIQEHGEWVNDEPITEIKYMVYKSAIGAIKEVKYLHDLQNLYFALTGNELEIEL